MTWLAAELDEIGHVEILDPQVELYCEPTDKLIGPDTALP
jgi:hypothetical protein